MKLFNRIDHFGLQLELMEITDNQYGKYTIRNIYDSYQIYVNFLFIYRYLSAFSFSFHFQLDISLTNEASVFFVVFGYRYVQSCNSITNIHAYQCKMSNCFVCVFVLFECASIYFHPFIECY